MLENRSRAPFAVHFPRPCVRRRGGPPGRCRRSKETDATRTRRPTPCHPPEFGLGSPGPVRELLRQWPHGPCGKDACGAAPANGWQARPAHRSTRDGARWHLRRWGDGQGALSASELQTWLERGAGSSLDSASGRSSHITGKRRPPARARPGPEVPRPAPCSLARSLSRRTGLHTRFSR